MSIFRISRIFVPVVLTLLLIAGCDRKQETKEDSTGTTSIAISPAKPGETAVPAVENKSTGQKPVILEPAIPAVEGKSIGQKPAILEPAIPAVESKSVGRKPVTPEPPVAPEKPPTREPATEPEPKPEPPSIEDKGASSGSSGSDESREKKDSEPLPPRASGKKVARVIDGDSVALDDGNELRYIGIDAPEVEDPLHDEASALNKKLVAGKELILEFDRERRDSHRRLLAYVYVAGEKPGEKIFVNAEMVRNGLARIYRHVPNDRYDDLLLKLQREARKAKKGMWKLAPPGKREKCYVSSHTSNRFHRPSCKYASTIAKDDREEYKTRDAAFDAAKSPCRECKP